ncbi:MAG: cation transporter [Clostridia bacterium]|nr:cation transporter [Clostridia bacterium]
MTKVFSLSDVDCPVCAGKMQEAIAGIDGVISARIDFLVLKLTIEAEEKDFPKIMKQAAKVVRRIEPDCEIEEI